MAANAGTSSVIGRDVLYRFRFEVDNSIKTATENIAKQSEQAFERVTKAKKKQTDASAKATDEEIRKADEAKKKIEEVAKAYENANVRRRAADMQLVASSKQALEGITQLGRSFVLLGISSEKDLQKAVKALAGFEAGVNALKGTINLIEAATKAWGAYRAAVLAAGVAQTAGGALGALGAGAGAAAGGVGKDIAVGAAGDIIGGATIGGTAAVAGKSTAAGTLGTSIGTTIAAIVTSPAFIATGIAAGIAALGEFAYTGGGAKLGPMGNAVMSIPGYRGLAEALGPGLFGSGDGGAQRGNQAFLAATALRQSQAERQAGVDSIQAQFRIRQTEAMLSAAAFQGQSAMPGTRGTLLGVRNQISELRTDRADLGGGTALLDRTIGLREQELALVRQVAQEQKQAATERMRALESELSRQQKIAETIRGQLTTAAERFGQLGAVEQQRAIDAKRKMDSGASLSQDERRRLRAIGLDSVNDRVRAMDIADANNAGFGRFFGGEERRKLAESGREQQRIAVAIERQRDFIVKVESNVEAEASYIAGEIGRLMVAREEKLRRLVIEEVQRFQDNLTETRARDAQTAAALSQ